MIQRLRAKHWRAYDRLDLELGPGATFVVASNGLGKTSLVMAAAWGLFGDLLEFKGVEQIRGDSERATVTVDLRLPSAGTLSITRSVDQRGRTYLEAQIGEKSFETQVQVDAILAEEFGADAHVLAQLTFMIHGGLLETQGEFKLQDHLASVFGVSPLFIAAASAEALAAEAAAALRRMKAVQGTDRRQRDRLIAELHDAEQALATILQVREAATERMNEASERLRLAEEGARFRGAIEERKRKFHSLADVASSLLQQSVDPEILIELLFRRESEAEGALAAADTDAAIALGKVHLIEEAMSQLQNSEAACPTCLRPLSEHEANRAEEQHGQHLRELTVQAADAEETAKLYRTLLRELRQLLRQVQAVPMPLSPGEKGITMDPTAARVHYEIARDEVRALDLEITARSSSSKSIREALETLDVDERQTLEQEALYRQEAIATAAMKTFKATGDAITEQHIEPLVADVARRWKLIFGGGGLKLSSDGRITREVGSRTLPFEALSGGEKVWALLLTRLLVAGASTHAPFVWLDEPLEHLDPRLRKVVAGTLAVASSGVGLRQVIVTTYETQLAQQLMEDVPSAALIYVTSSD